jgi:hypothetical protein
MTPSHFDSDQEDRWSSEGWTGEHDSAAAIALAVSLALGAILFLILAAMQLG